MKQWLVLLGLALILLGCGNDEDEARLDLLEETLEETQTELEKTKSELAEVQESAQETGKFVDEFERLRIVEIVDEKFDVPAAKIVFFKFTVPPFEKDKASVAGDFRAKGNDNLITVMLFEELQYLKWVDGQAAEFVWGSGRVTNGKIDVDLKAEGIYYLVFSNLESNFFKREVTSEVDLFYLVPE